MAEPQIRFNDGASYERMMGIWSRLAGDVFIDWRRARACDGSTSAAVVAPSASCWSNAARRPRSRASIRPKGSSPLRAHGPQRAWRNFARATRWRCPSPTTGLMPP